jgi:hypothetical protein
MTDDVQDPMLRRAIDSLRELPAVDQDAMQRIISAAAVARVTPADEPVTASVDRQARSVRLWSAVGLAAAAAIVGFFARGAWAPTSAESREHVDALASAPAPAAAGMTPVSTSRLDAAMIPRQFVLENSRARRVSVVGDFNKWNAASDPMTQSGVGGLWSAMIPMVPGRHVYGFMIDDSLFVLDPREPRARDPDLGTEASVIMVGRP